MLLVILFDQLRLAIQGRLIEIDYLTVFILYPVEGLGNRFRAIDSALRYCEATKTRLSVRWHRDEALMNCRWIDLFEPQKGFFEAGWDYRLLQFVYKLKRHSALFLGILSMLKKLRILVICGPDDWAELREVTASSKRYLFIVAETFSIFYWPDGCDFKKDAFVLNEVMKKRLSSEISRFGDNTVGVHIRRTDNIDSIRQSPLDLFEAEMAEGISKGLKYYVCSDDPSVKDALVRKFGQENIILPSGALERNSLEGIRQAAVELFALSKTRYILGSYYSSFSEMASYLGGIELKVMKK